MSWNYRSNKDFPKVYTDRHFLYLIKEKKKSFIEFCSNKNLYYKKGTEPKSDGGHREIYKPVWELKVILKKINRRYLSKLNYPLFIHCGPKGRSIVTACRPHMNFNLHLALDIESFFDRVSKNVTTDTLKKIGIEKPIIKMIADISVEDNRLPQGFPTSSLLSTLAVSFVLQDFYSNFSKKDLALSLYADDILISSNDRELICNVEKFIKKRIDTIGLSLNSQKRDFGKKGEKFVWLGLQIHPWVSIPRDKLRILQKEVYTYKTEGIVPENFKPDIKIKRRRKKKWKESVRGKTIFAQSVSQNKLIEKIDRDLI